MRTGNGTWLIRLELLLWTLQDKILMILGGHLLIRAIRLNHRMQNLPGLTMSPREILWTHRLRTVVRQTRGVFDSSGTGVTNDDDEVWSERAAGDDAQGARDNWN